MKEWNQEELVSFLKIGSSGLLYFYTPMCGTCQVSSKMMDVVKEIVDLDIGKMNLNYYPQLASSFKIESVPCLIFIKEGKVLDKIYAFHSVPYLMDKIHTIYKADA